MRTVWLSSLVLCAVFSVVAAAQTPPAKNDDKRIESAPASDAGDVMSRVPERSPAAEGSKGDGLTTGKDGDPIGATNDDRGRQGETHSDPTLATKPAPASDPKAQ
jgi:hypothetical protein